MLSVFIIHRQFHKLFKKPKAQYGYSWRIPSYYSHCFPSVFSLLYSLWKFPSCRNSHLTATRTLPLSLWFDSFKPLVSPWSIPSRLMKNRAQSIESGAPTPFMCDRSEMTAWKASAQQCCSLSLLFAAETSYLILSDNTLSLMYSILQNADQADRVQV